MGQRDAPSRESAVTDRSKRASRGRINFEGFRFSTTTGAALLADEAENAIDPNSLLLRLWYHALLVCILLEAFVLPFFVAFKPNAPHTQPKELYVVMGCELFFLVDLVVQAHTGYYDDGNIVRDRRKTRVRYLKSKWILLDVFTLVPFSYLLTVPRMSKAATEMHKLLRWVRLPKYIAVLDDMYAKQFAAVKIFKLVVSTIYLSHFVACIRFSFGYNEHHDDHWLPAIPHEPPHVLRQYLTALFWSFGLLSGLFEGELPTRIPEFAFAVFVASCGFTLFTTLCAMFFMISKCESGDTEAAEARIHQLKHLLSFHHVPVDLQKQAIEYLQRYYTDEESNDREVMKLVCPSIKQDIQVELLKDTVARIPLFEGCREDFIVAVTSLLQLISLPAQTTVFEAGEVGDSMYIVQSGVLHVIISGVTVREMRKGTCFGELSVFLDSPRTATIVTATYSTLYKLSRFHGERVLQGYPECAATISVRISLMGKKNNGQKQSIISLRSSSSHSRFDFKRMDASAITAKIRQQANSVPLFGWFKKNSYVLPGVADTEESPVTTSPDARIAALDEKDMLKSYYDQKHAEMPRETVSNLPWLAKHILFHRCIDAQSSRRMWWLFLIDIVLTYNWVMIPLRLSFPVFNRPMWYVDFTNVVADLVLLVDIYLNFNLSYTENAEKIMDTSRSAVRYLKGGFMFDIFCLMPFWILSAQSKNFKVRILRLVRCRAWFDHYQEISSFYRLTNRGRLVILGIFFFMLYHIIACMHFGVTSIEGFSSDDEAWIPSEDIYLVQINNTHYLGYNHTIYSVDDPELNVIAARQYFRSLYYAANVLAALGKTIEPESDVQYAIALIFMLGGFLITAVVVDIVQKRFTASAYEQKQFYSMRTRIQLFLRRQNAPDSIFQRVNSFLDFWWSSHRGAFISELIADLPAAMKLQILHSICNPALQTIGLLPNARPFLDKLEDFFVTNVKFILYGQGEVVYRQGDYANGLFFLLEGDVCVIANADNPRSIPLGGFFGSAVLRATETSLGYGEHVSAAKGCILLFISRDHLHGMDEIYPGFSSELAALESKLLRNKLMISDLRGSTGRVSGRMSGRRGTAAPVPARQRTIWSRVFGPAEVALDPDSKMMMLWEIWLFVAMTIQWLTVTIQICFRMKKARYIQADVAAAVLEISFFVDIYLRTRLGYYAFGNKIMDPQVIRHSYIQSRTFFVDAISLTPLYAVNWFRTPEQRLDVLNVNKVLRVLKVPAQLRALENRYLKRTTELRLFKLFYYTFLLAHMFGCMWFDFASNSSHIFNTSMNANTEFGDDSWLPPASLESVALNKQYFASLFWSFGLMSASSTGELPKTAQECVFAVITMTCGFFLFAYVVGNFTDIIELADGGSRDFVERLSAVRLVKSHFALPRSISDQIMTYFCFQRYHTITQERHLERCLPPSLLTDIRLVHLKPMIGKVSFLSGMEGSVTRMLVSQFHQMLVLREEYVCKYGEEGFDMYFVFTGVLDVLLPTDMITSEEVSDRITGGGGQEEAEPISQTGAFANEDPFAGRLKKVNELNSGSYFGENGLFTKSLRNAYVRASTSCILYKLSRDSLELVFERYPQWKEKVLRIANLQREQQRLARMSAEEQNRHSDESNGSMLSRIDLINRRAERMEEEMQIVRLRRMDSTQSIRPRASKARRKIEQILKDPVIVLWRSLTVGASAQSRVHRLWLWLMIFSSIFIAAIIPYRIAIDPLSQISAFGEVMKAIEVFCEVMFVLDIRFSWRVQESKSSMELYEQTYRVMYTKERLKWDIIASFPLDRLLVDFTSTPWLRLLRCAKIINVPKYMEELNRRSVSTQFNRFRGFVLMYLLAIYWAGCAYLAISEVAGFGDEWNSWRPSKVLAFTRDEMPSTETVTLRYFRGFFFGVTSFVKKGKTFTPDSTPLNIFAVLTCFTGMLVMSFMISEFASLYISYIWNEVDFRKTHIAVELYLDRVRVSDELKRRTQRLMSSLWSSHSGVNYEAVFRELPPSIKRAAIIYVVKKPLHLFTGTTFRMLACDSRIDLDEFAQKIAQYLRFEGYPRDENVVAEGSISRAMFFVVRGHLMMQSKTNAAFARTIVRRGQYFGDRGLLGCAVSMITVRTIRACDLLSISSEDFLSVLEGNCFSHVALTLVARAQSALETRAGPECSRQEMEIRWADALLSELRDLKKSNDRSAFYSANNGPRLSSEHIDRLAHVLDTAADCVHAFLPFLYLVLPFDPFDWNSATKNAQSKRRMSSPVPNDKSPGQGTHAETSLSETVPSAFEAQQTAVQSPEAPFESPRDTCREVSAGLGFSDVNAGAARATRSDEISLDKQVVKTVDWLATTEDVSSPRPDSAAKPLDAST